MVALFATVVLGQTQLELKPPDLPTCITNWVKMNMKAYTIDKSFKISNKGEISYVVRTIMGKETQWLLFNKDCSSVKKISAEEAAALINLPAPPTTTKPPVPKDPPTTTKPPVPGK